MNRKAIIVGGGVGGLTAAICLRQIGWDVKVFETAPLSTEIGAGIQISPNGVKILQEIGVMRLLEESLFEPDSIEIRLGKSGRKLVQLPMKDVAADRWGARYVQIHRSDLIVGLNNRLAQLSPNSVETGSEVVSFDDRANTAIIKLQNGKTHEADLVVGADGIHSTIRKQMFGAEKARFTGNVAWRAVIPVERLGGLVPPPTGCIWAGKQRHAVTTRIRSGQTVNFVGIVEHSDWKIEGWKIEGQRADALADFKDWNPTITNLIKKAESLHKWALFDRAPLPHWHTGHVALLGDAAHPMLPSMAQGAVQSMEDAYILAQSVASSSSSHIPSACNDYFQKRIRRTTKVQKVSMKNLNLFHKKNAWTQFIHYAPIWVAGHFTPILIQKRYDWLYGKEFGPLDPTSLN